VAVDPGDRVVVCALGGDRADGAGVLLFGVGVLRLESFGLAAEVFALGAVALEEAERVDPVVCLSDAEFDVAELFALSVGLGVEGLERACLAGREGVELLPDAVLLLVELGGGQDACAGLGGFV
jgi:hypothetical protein